MAGSAGWKCADCDSNNGPKDTACSICGSTRRTPMPRPAEPTRPAPKRPSPARPSGDWQCRVCRATNPARRSTCSGCAKSREETGGPAPKTTPKSTPPRTTTSRVTSTGTGGKGAAKKAAPKKAAPSRPTPRRTTSPPRSGGATGSGSTPTGLLFPPPSGTGYTPPRRTPAPAPAPPAYTDPGPYAPPTSYRPPVKEKKSRGCLFFFLLIAVLVVVAIQKGWFAQLGDAIEDAGTEPATGTPRPTAAACPSRIADELRGGDGATLVEAFRTENKQITLCRTRAGTLYYFGEFSDRREPGIAMRATRTEDGYEATNSPYRYVIRGSTVSVYKSGTRIGREELVPEPSPS
ncbi:zinc finger protein [Streptomyces sp. NPDC057695]|uniref:zinc finger protein n=1 Tax=Streptomyces sp. NPDC057695 TaxID=3346217 RepID=UPI0036853EC9